LHNKAREAIAVVLHRQFAVLNHSSSVFEIKPTFTMIGLTLPQIVQSFYILTTATALLLYSVPQLQKTFLSYGKTAIPPTTDGKEAKTTEAKASGLHAALQNLGSIQVSHSWFSHFYIFSILSSIFWGIQFATRGPILESLINLNGHSAQSQPLNQSIDRVYLAWACLLVQGIRRYYETVYVSKASHSKMWVGHYVLGILYYAATGVAMWAEGADSLRNHQFNFSKLTPMSAPSVRTMLVLPVFILASGAQNDCHVYLASLKKYTLPQVGLFQYIICPHYFAEIIIYIALAVLAAPDGQLFNKTILSTTVFVIVNLGMTAKANQKWYMEKFGEESVKGRWKMIPFVY
jgi:3-oxo-5-alpha-steroid 4-dehydrogenase 3